jgi:hypothetical protein
MIRDAGLGGRAGFHNSYPQMKQMKQIQENRQDVGVCPEGGSAAKPNLLHPFHLWMKKPRKRH